MPETLGPETSALMDDSENRLREALEDHHMAGVARNRFEAVRAGRDELVDADEFWAKAEEILARISSGKQE